MPTEAPNRVDIFPATPQQAAEAVKKFNGDGRTIAEIPEMIEELSEKSKVYIFNVGPWAQTQSCGSLGVKHIPACPEGKDYSEPLVLDGLMIERYPLREGTMDLLMHKNATGWNVAGEIIGAKGTPHTLPGNSLEKYGIFRSRSNPPKKEEIAEARKNLNRHLNMLVNEARSAAAQGQKAAEDTIRPDQHIRAGIMLGLDPQVELWMNSAIPQVKREKCEACGKPYETGQMICGCGFILDQAKYEKNKDRFVKK